MGVLEFLSNKGRKPDYTKTVRKVGTWKRVWRVKSGAQPYVEKDKEISKMIQIGSSPVNVRAYVDAKSNQNLLIVGATGQGKSKLMRYLLSEMPYQKFIFSFKAGRIDLIARKGKFRVAVEYGHHSLIKWGGFQRIVQIKPEAAIAITDGGTLEPNAEQAKKYLKYLNSALYVVSLRQKRYQKFEKANYGIFTKVYKFIL